MTLDLTDSQLSLVRWALALYAVGLEKGAGYPPPTIKLALDLAGGRMGVNPYVATDPAEDARVLLALLRERALTGKEDGDGAGPEHAG